MLSISKQQVGTTLRVELKGVLDETTDLERSLGTGFQEIEVNARQVGRINSIGIKTWRNYFHKLRCEAIKIRFFELSPELVFQLNFLSDFAELDEVQSVCAPFLCMACSTAIVKVFTLENLRQQGATMGPIPCPKCKGRAEFDDVAEEYFSFLNG